MTPTDRWYYRRWIYPIVGLAMIGLNIVAGAVVGLSWITVAGVAVTAFLAGASFQVSKDWYR